MSEKLLEIKDLYVEYDTDEAVVNAVNGLNLSIGKGEALGFVGETGAGKTTTALSIMKLLPEGIGEIVGGSIDFGGIDIVHASKREMHKILGARISMIFQDPMTSLNPIVPVGDQIREVLELHAEKMTKEQQEKRVEEVLEMVGIQARRKVDFPFQFSGGMKQRIGIAMALVAEPELLIADEPTTALDVTIQAQVLHLMSNLKKQLDTSMILITHDLGVVAEFCDNVAIIYAGEVIEYGRVEDVFTREKNHPYTEGLFKSIPDIKAEADRLVPIPGVMVDPTNLPTGCKFAGRCEYRTDQCAKAEVATRNVSKTHSIKCLRFADGGKN